MKIDSKLDIKLPPNLDMKIALKIFPDIALGFSESLSSSWSDAFLDVKSKLKRLPAILLGRWPRALARPTDSSMGESRTTERIAPMGRRPTPQLNGISSTDNALLCLAQVASAGRYDNPAPIRVTLGMPTDKAPRVLAPRRLAMRHGERALA
jgi:hypothetical protein